MADRFYGYQYGTSPRKLEYSSYGRRYPQEKEPEQYEVNSKKTYVYKDRQVTKSKVNNDFQDNVKTEKVTKATIKAKIRIVSLLFASFAILFAVSYQNSLISESFNKKEQYKKEWESLSKTNQQIEVSIENNLNLNNIEQVAKEKLGMQKLSNDQKIYVNLPKEDYVSSAAEQVVIEEDQNFFVKLFKGFTKAIK